MAWMRLCGAQNRRVATTTSRSLIATSGDVESTESVLRVAVNLVLPTSTPVHWQRFSGDGGEKTLQRSRAERPGDPNRAGERPIWVDNCQS